MRNAPIEMEALTQLAGSSSSSFSNTSVPSYLCGANAPHDVNSCVRCAFIRGYMTRAIIAYHGEVA